MGDALPGRNALLEARVTGAAGDGWTLAVYRNGTRIDEQSFDDSLTLQIAARPGEYRVQVEKSGIVHALTNPIGVGDNPRLAPPGVRAGGRSASLRLRVLRVRRRGSRVDVSVQVRSNGGAPLSGIRVRSGRASDVTDSRGRGSMTLTRVFEPGKFRATASAEDWRSARATFRVR
jgi:hypothetical protein